MALTELYSNYFQKSKSFLYPALGIRKDVSVVPIETYISWENKIKETDNKLIVLYNYQKSIGYNNFEKNVLLNNHLFHSFYECENDTIAYVFTFEEQKANWDNFLNGKYSKLSGELKHSILSFYGRQTKEGEYAKSFLYPHQYYEMYADLLIGSTHAKYLDITVEELKNVGELCEPYNKNRENLFVKTKCFVELKEIT